MARKKSQYALACEALEADPTLTVNKCADVLGVPVGHICQAFWRNGVRFTEVRAEIQAKAA